MKRTCRFAALLLLPGTAALAAPALHEIAYPENYPSTADEYGADAYGGSLNHPQSAYYIINDFYNMVSGGSLHILEKFETCQQTAEYSCGPSSALMVLYRFGADDYDEMQLGTLMKDGYYIFLFGRFFDMWREGPCAEKAEPYVQAYVVAQPKA